MSCQSTDTLFHSNRYSAENACEHCDCVIRHEPWCITVDPAVLYAYQIVLEPGMLEPGAAIIFHSLGVSWDRTARRAKCGTSKAHGSFTS
jgi:hypothetical protein